VILTTKLVKNYEICRYAIKKKNFFPKILMREGGADCVIIFAAGWENSQVFRSRGPAANYKVASDKG